jgi:hypothetical protein
MTPLQRYWFTLIMRAQKMLDSFGLKEMSTELSYRERRVNDTEWIYPFNKIERYALMTIRDQWVDRGRP